MKSEEIFTYDSAMNSYPETIPVIISERKETKTFSGEIENGLLRSREILAVLKKNKLECKLLESAVEQYKLDLKDLQERFDLEKEKVSILDERYKREKKRATELDKKYKEKQEVVEELTEKFKQDQETLNKLKIELTQKCLAHQKDIKLKNIYKSQIKSIPCKICIPYSRVPVFRDHSELETHIKMTHDSDFRGNYFYLFP